MPGGDPSLFAYRACSWSSRSTPRLVRCAAGGEQTAKRKSYDVPLVGRGGLLELSLAILRGRRVRAVFEPGEDVVAEISDAIPADALELGPIAAMPADFDPLNRDAQPTGQFLGRQQVVEVAGAVLD